MRDISSFSVEPPLTLHPLHQPPPLPKDGTMIMFRPSWTDDPTGVDGTNLYEWVSVRIGTSGSWGEYSTPAIWARFSADGTDGTPGARGEKGDKGDQGDTGAAGSDGADGSGFEMVFQRNNSATAPASITTTNAQRTTDDFVPTGWSDDPTGVTQANQYEWVAIRTGSTGQWSEFSTPSLWAKFSVKTVHQVRRAQMVQVIDGEGVVKHDCVCDKRHCSTRWKSVGVYQRSHGRRTELNGRTSTYLV